MHYHIWTSLTISIIAKKKINQSACSLYIPSKHVFGGDGRTDGTEYSYIPPQFLLTRIKTLPLCPFCFLLFLPLCHPPCAFPPPPFYFLSPLLVSLVVAFVSSPLTGCVTAAVIVIATSVPFNPEKPWQG